MEEKQKINPENIVKDIFERPKSGAQKISSIFTHFKRPPKTTPQKPIASKDIGGSLFLKKLPAAVDIGTSSIKIFQLGERGPKGELEIVAIDKEEYGLDTHKAGPYLQQKEVLKRIVSRNRIGPEIITAIGAKDVQIYNLVFPLIADTELNEAIRWKITQLKPFGLDAEQVVYSYIKWDHLPGPRANQHKIFLVCTSKELIQRRIALFEELGLKVKAISVGPISLINLYNLPTPLLGKEETVIWLDIGAQESSLVISRGSTLYFCRALVLTSKNMTRQISEYCHISEKDAEALKREYGLMLWSPDKKIPVFLEAKEPQEDKEDKAGLTYRSLISYLENGIVDIQHSFKYFSYQITHSQITSFDRVMLSGGGSNLKNLSEFLSAKLGVPAEIANPFSSLSIPEALKNQKKALLGPPAEFTICVSLALNFKTEKSKCINLIPKEKRTILTFIKEHKHEKPLQAAAVVIFLAVSLIAVQITRLGYHTFKLKEVAGRVKEIQLQVNRSPSEQMRLAEEETKLSEKGAKLKERLDMLNASTRHPADLSEVLAQVANLIPEEVWVRQLSYSGSKLNIIGSTANTDIVLRMIETLKSSERFIDVEFNYSQREQGQEFFNFEAIAEIKR